jgi:hypothetical protein
MHVLRRRRRRHRSRFVRAHLVRGRGRPLALYSQTWIPQKN